MEILLNQLRIFSLRQRGHQQYTRFCRVEESATSPGWLSSGGTTPLPVREARTTTMPACCAFDTGGATYRHRPRPGSGVDNTVGMMGDRRIVHIPGSSR